MIRLWRVVLALVIVFALAVGVILAQPQEDATMRDFFTSPCAPPCFMGIRPGITTTEQALALLRAHPWVKGVSPAASTFGTGARSYTNIYWGWTGQQPAFIFDASSASLPYLHIYKGIVQYIRLVTHIPYGAAWLILGMPSSGSLIVDGNNLGIQTVTYFGGMLAFDSNIACPMNSAVRWNAPISITYSDGTLTAYSRPGFHLDRASYRSKCQ